ncbi:MAG: hypothetical protein JWQ38_2174 [Flavipsychrobacter sp.]|nr:hypothetical protein [Flavipsychrobacter sp.]
MNKLLLLLACCSISHFACHSQTTNSYNLDMETLNATTHLPTGWGLDNVNGPSIPDNESINAFKADNTERQSGKYSLLIDWTKPYKEWTASNYVIPAAFEGSTIKLTGHIKTENVAGGAGLWMRLDGVRGKNLGFDNMMNRSVKGNTGWTEYSIEMEYDADEVKQIVVGGLIMGTGKMWMDNLHITIDGKDLSAVPHRSQTLSKYKAETDTAFVTESGVKSIILNSDKIKELTNLGMLWGFIKYYHANVNKGEYNMDAELFRVLPKVLAATNIDAANKIMEQWVDEFGKAEVCNSCITPEKGVTQQPDYGYLFAKNNLPKTLTDKLEYIKQNRIFDPAHYYISSTRGIGNPIFKNEQPYHSIAYPDAGMSLLSLYRYWNMIQYFFPYKHLTGEDWNKVLVEFLPEFCNAVNAKDYQVACLKLIARIHDTHANVWSGGDELMKMKGIFLIPVRATFVENKLVVTEYYKQYKDIKSQLYKGDIIEKIDGIPVDEIVKKYLAFTPASNYETQLRDIADVRGFLMRSPNESTTLTIKRNGINSDVITKNENAEKMSARPEQENKETVGYKMLRNNIGYIYPAKLNASDLDSIKILFQNTKGLVIDMRCYPSTFMPFTYGSWLKGSKSEFAKFTIGDIAYPGYFEMSDGAENGVKNNDHYKGKVVIIVNATTQSQAEYTTMALQTAPHATVIGSTTAGADGNVSEIYLPGGIGTMISGIGVLYPDGTETQRKGVKIDKVVKPTIKGIKDGKDELLDAAINIIIN